MTSARLTTNEPKNIDSRTTIWLVAKILERVSEVERSLNHPSETMLVAAIQKPIKIRMIAHTHSLNQRKQTRMLIAARAAEAVYMRICPTRDMIRRVNTPPKSNPTENIDIIKPMLPVFTCSKFKRSGSRTFIRPWLM